MNMTQRCTHTHTHGLTRYAYSTQYEHEVIIYIQNQSYVSTDRSPNL